MSVHATNGPIRVSLPPGLSIAGRHLVDTGHREYGNREHRHRVSHKPAELQQLVFASTITFMTSFPFITLLLSIFLTWQRPVLACRCVDLPTAASALNQTENVFRGLVVRELKQPVDDATMKRFVVRVGRVFKGCSSSSSSFEMSDRIIISTGTHSCGSFLEIAQTYVFSGTSLPIDAATKSLLGKNTKISLDVSIHLCTYNPQWPGISQEDIKVLRKYKNECQE